MDGEAIRERTGLSEGYSDSLCLCKDWPQNRQDHGRSAKSLREVEYESVNRIAEQVDPCIFEGAKDAI